MLCFHGKCFAKNRQATLEVRESDTELPMSMYSCQKHVGKAVQNMVDRTCVVTPITVLLYSEDVPPVKPREKVKKG